MNAARNSTATATTDTADTPDGGYVGRFAPSPTGELHVGSLYTAAASYLDARVNHGSWLVRIEDLDRPRVVPGAAATILRTLEQFGFQWDSVVYQSERLEYYVAALEACRSRGLIFDCSCSRTQLPEDQRYPGTCRTRPFLPGVPAAIRLRVDPGYVQFTDCIQGTFRQDVAATVGDVILRRRDRVFSYLLAVVIDDAAQGITHIVRGADLLDNTPRQIYVQRLLNLKQPVYAHVPVLTETDGRKLAKSARSVSLAWEEALSQLLEVFGLLGLAPPLELSAATLDEAWAWAIRRWDINAVPKRLACPLGAPREGL